MNTNRCVIIFAKHPVVDYTYTYDDKYDVFEIITTVGNAQKKSLVIDYVEAKLRLKYLGFHISRRWGLGTPNFRNIDNDIKSAKSQITKITNAISKYEEEELKKLLPDFENQKYLRTKEKLIEYKSKLENLKKEKNQ
jgi:hypothetical protein